MKALLVSLLCLLLSSSGRAAPPSVPEETAPPGAGAASTHALQQGIALMLRAVDHAESLLPQMSQAAEGAAARWIAGGDLYAGGDANFTEEAFYRAGGPIGLRRIGPCRRDQNGIQRAWDEVPDQSVILYGMPRPADPNLLLFDDLGHLMFERDTVVFFGSSAWLACRRSVEGLERRARPGHFYFIDTGVPLDAAFVTATGRPYGDYAGMVTAIHQWAFTAELVAACTRQNKTPALWPSGAIPGYEEWEKTYEHTNFHDDLTVPPIAAGVLGRRYLDILRRQLRACEGVAPRIQAAARMLAAVPADRGVYVMVDSHLLAGATELPNVLRNWMLVQRPWRWRRAALTVEKGDGILWLGSFDWPSRDVEAAAGLGNPFVGVSLYGPGRRPTHAPLVMPRAAPPEGSPDAATIARIEPEPATTDGDPDPPGVVWIPAPWQYPDAAVEIEGYPLPACPTSSIVQGTLLWALMGEVIGLLPD
jgi:hypothetical protein